MDRNPLIEELVVHSGLPREFVYPEIQRLAVASGLSLSTLTLVDLRRLVVKMLAEHFSNEPDCESNYTQ